MSSVADVPVQPSLRRIHSFGIRPNRDLGQNFLIDSNILGVIERAAELEQRDVVLEIGGGLGVLSEHLAERVGHVHVVEIDERLRDALTDATEPHANVSVHWGDAMTIELLDSVGSWVAMVQREVGERLAAAPGGGDYGTPSVIAQLACEVHVLRAVPRTVFYPAPNVDSVLVGMRRLTDAGRAITPSPALRALVGGSFAHRRKTLARSLALSGRANGRSREQIRAALEGLGHPADVRAERLSPEDFRALAVALGL